MADINSILRIPDGNGNVRVIGGRDGKDGQDGATGSAGPTGATGATGATGPQGPAGATGATGPSGSSTAPAQNQRLSIKTTSDYAGGAIALVGPLGTVNVTPGTQNAQAIADAVEATYAAGAVIAGTGTSTPGSGGTVTGVNVSGAGGISPGANPTGASVNATYTAGTTPYMVPGYLAPLTGGAGYYIVDGDATGAPPLAGYWYLMFSAEPGGSNSRVYRAPKVGGDTTPPTTGWTEGGVGNGQTPYPTVSLVTTGAAPASLDITLELAGTLAGTNPPPLTTTTAGVAIQVLQFGAPEGPGATLAASNAETVARQVADEALQAQIDTLEGTALLSNEVQRLYSLTGVNTGSINLAAQSGGTNQNLSVSDSINTLQTKVAANYDVTIPTGDIVVTAPNLPTSLTPLTLTFSGASVAGRNWPLLSFPNDLANFGVKTLQEGGVPLEQADSAQVGVQRGLLQVVETDAAGLFITAVKADAYNKPFGTTSGTIAQGNDTRIVNAISQTTADGRYLRLATANTSTVADTTTISDAVTNALTIVRTHGHNSSATPTTGFGLRERFQLKSSTTNARDVGYLDFSWATATDGSRAARGVLSAVDFAATRECIRFEASGTAPLIGFLGATAQPRTTLPAAATDAATTQTLVNAIRTLLINVGLAA